MNYQLIQGDCLEIMPTLAAQSVDMICTDPPYGITNCAWDSVIPFAPMWESIKRVIKPRGAVVLFGSQPFTSALVMSNPKWFRYQWVWEKDNAGNPGLAKFQPLRYHEDVVVFYDNQCTYNPQRWNAGFRSNTPGRNGTFGMAGKRMTKGGGETFSCDNYDASTFRYPKSIIRFDRPKTNTGAIHPTQKPVDLMSYLVKTYTNPGETVLDFTMGSGSTGVACAETGRNFVGIELDASYFAIAQERIEAAYRKAQGLPRRGKPTDLDALPLFA